MGFSLLFDSLSGQSSVSASFGFHSEVIKAGQTTPLGINVTRSPGATELAYTVGQLFGQENQAGLLANDPDRRNGDVVWLKEGDRWVQIYWNEGWKAVGAGDKDFSERPIEENTGVFITSRAEEDSLLVFGGYLLSQAVAVDVFPGYNLVARGWPVPITLDETHLSKSPGLSSEDVVWLWDGAQYLRLIWDGNTWTDLNGGGNFGSTLVPSLLVIQVNGPGGLVVVHPPRYLGDSKSLPDRKAPTPPAVALGFSATVRGNPTFRAEWQSSSSKLEYSTEIWSRHGWFSIGRQRGDSGEILFSEALLHRLKCGAARVRVEHIGRVN